MKRDRHKATRGALSAALLAAAVLTACGGRHDATQPLRLQGKAQGTYYSIIYYDSLGRDLQGAVDTLLTAFDQTASLWVAESQLRRINENRDSVVDGLFADLLTKSVAMHELTEGCFDCTVGKLVNAWGFGFANREQMSDSLVAALLQYTGRQPALADAGDGRYIVRKPHAETELDFNAIAQGYSTDMVAQLLERHGISNYLVDIGGEVYTHGCKPDGSLWSVGVERPAENRYSSPEVETSIQLSGLSVVTSGNYRKYYEKDGVRYSHTIDPKSGYPVEHTLLSVSVVDSSAWRADALATAFMVMGLERALAFIREHPDDSGTQAVFFIYNVEGHYKTYATPGFEKLISKQ